MTTLLELAPRDAGDAVPDVDVEFSRGVGMNENVVCFLTCAVVCGTSDCGGLLVADEI